MKIEIDFSSSAVPEGFELTGEFRSPNSAEYYISDTGKPLLCEFGGESWDESPRPRFILREVYYRVLQEIPRPKTASPGEYFSACPAGALYRAAVHMAYGSGTCVFKEVTEQVEVKHK